MKFQLAAILFLSVLLTNLFAQEPESQSAQPQLSTLQGVLEPVESLRLATRDAGIVTELNVREGDVVTAGTAIAALDSELFEAEYQAAKREFEIATEEAKNDVDLEYAKISTEVNGQVLDRSREANRQFSKTVSGTEIERLRLEFERSRLSGEQAIRTQEVKQLTSRLRAEQVEIARIRKENRVVKSKIDGTVVEILYSPGEYVSAGYPIARILNLNKLRVKCAGDARITDPSQINPIAEFKYMKGDESISIPAVITFVSPEIDPVRQTFAIWAEIENSDRKLRSGMVGTLDLKTKL